MLLRDVAATTFLASIDTHRYDVSGTGTLKALMSVTVLSRTCQRTPRTALCDDIVPFLHAQGFHVSSVLKGGARETYRHDYGVPNTGTLKAVRA